MTKQKKHRFVIENYVIEYDRDNWYEPWAVTNTEDDMFYFTFELLADAQDAVADMLEGVW